MTNFERTPKLYAYHFLDDTVLVWGIHEAVQSSEKLISLVVPGGGFLKGILLQGILTPTGILTNRRS